MIDFPSDKNSVHKKKVECQIHRDSKDPSKIFVDISRHNQILQTFTNAISNKLNDNRLSSNSSRDKCLSKTDLKDVLYLDFRFGYIYQALCDYNLDDSLLVIS